MGKKFGTTIRLIEQVAGLFDSSCRGDTWLVLASDRSVEGCEGVPGLHLIAGCLAERFYEMGEPRPPQPATREGRAVEIHNALAKLAARPGAWFIACYRLRGSTACEMAWSDALGPDTVYRELVTFVQNGLILAVD